MTSAAATHVHRRNIADPEVMDGGRPDRRALLLEKPVGRVMRFTLDTVIIISAGGGFAIFGWHKTA